MDRDDQLAQALGFPCDVYTPTVQSSVVSDKDQMAADLWLEKQRGFNFYHWLKLALYGEITF
jgi:hypothetical protein